MQSLLAEKFIVPTLQRGNKACDAPASGYGNSFRKETNHGNA
jgi:hypothetical protein